MRSAWLGSADMRIPVYWIIGFSPGRLGIVPRPRGGDWLHEEIQSLGVSGADVIVSLLEESEETELDLVREGLACEKHRLSFVSFPIGDRGVPSSKDATLGLADDLLKFVKDGKSVVVHCRQSVGRSSLIAACVLVLDGVAVDEAFQRITVARGCEVPDTRQQRMWVGDFARWLLSR
ncbi:MAG TPA: protein tyrosine phosphatase [Blastocatellia bacterium]|nr:protein tyrosine phosphatase [Blastocatellia bacterium]